MTRNEVVAKMKAENNYPSRVIGLCELCMYVRSCKDIKDNFNKPNDCDGPFNRYDD